MHLAWVTRTYALSVSFCYVVFFFAGWVTDCRNLINMPEVFTLLIYGLVQNVSKYCIAKGEPWSQK